LNEIKEESSFLSVYLNGPMSKMDRGRPFKKERKVDRTNLYISSWYLFDYYCLVGVLGRTTNSISSTW